MDLYFLGTLSLKNQVSARRPVMCKGMLPFYWFCNSVSADGSDMAASRFLLAAAACAILLRFAAESRESHCNGSVRRVNGALAVDFFDFGSDDFPLKFLVKSASQSSFFRFGIETRNFQCLFQAL